MSACVCFMDMDNKKLQRFIDAVRDEIDRKVSNILNEAEEEKKRILVEAEVKAKETTEHKLSGSQKRISLNAVRKVTMTELQLKKEILIHRETLTDALFEEVRQELLKFRNSSEYEKYLCELIKKSDVRDNCIVYLSPDDMKYVSALEKIVECNNVSFREDKSIETGGLSVYNTDCHTILNRTFDLALEENKQLFIENNAYSE